MQIQMSGCSVGMNSVYVILQSRKISFDKGTRKIVKLFFNRNSSVVLSKLFFFPIRLSLNTDPTDQRWASYSGKSYQSLRFSLYIVYLDNVKIRSWRLP